MAGSGSTSSDVSSRSSSDHDPLHPHHRPLPPRDRVTMVVRGLTTAPARRRETLEQIGAYGFAGSLPASDLGRGDAEREGAGRRLAGRDRPEASSSGSHASGRDYRAAACRGRHVHDDARTPARELSSCLRARWCVPLALPRRPGGMGGLLVISGRWRPWSHWVGCCRVSSSTSEARKRQRPGRADAPRPDRPARRDARSGAELPQGLRLAATKNSRIPSPPRCGRRSRSRTWA